MSAVQPTLVSHCEELARRARIASRLLAVAPTDAKNAWLRNAATVLGQRTDEILRANHADVIAVQDRGLTAAQLDRLSLSHKSIQASASAMREVAALPDPVGIVLEQCERPNGLKVRKVSVPLGVILFIYESRPNVTIDAAALCVKSGNAVLLRGGTEALQSNSVLVKVVRESLEDSGLPADAVQLIAPDRAAIGHLLKLDKYIDLVIPRGGESLIRRIAEEARMPVLKHYKGNCHVYVECSADLAMAEEILVNAKCQRPGVCNAAESLLVDGAIAADFLPRAARALAEKGVELRGCPTVCRLIPAAIPASDDDYAAEYLDLILSIKVVENLDEAIAHVNRFGSQHTEAIVTRDSVAASKFTQEVDSAVVLVNASTRFNDGGELGLGAEIGISTDKLHARGPCGLRELTSYKYVVHGNGQVRS